MKLKNNNSVSSITFKGENYNILLEETNNSFYLSAKDCSRIFEKNITTIYRVLQKTNLPIKQEEIFAKNAKIFLEGKTKKIQYYHHAYLRSLDLVFETNVGQEFIDNVFNQSSLKQNQNFDKIIIYNDDGMNFNINFSSNENTVWLNVETIAAMFGITERNVYYHIKNIYEEEKEIADSITNFCNQNQKSVKYSFSNLHEIIAQEKQVPLIKNGVPQNRSETLYNLNMILSIGYRTKTLKASKFRNWVSSVMNEYITKGYAINHDKVSMDIHLFNQMMNEHEQMKKDIQKIKEDILISPLKERIFYQGQTFDAYTFLIELLNKAQKSIIIIDGYFDTKGLQIISKTYNHVDLLLVVSSYAKIKNEEIEEFKNEYGREVELLLDNSFHDRFIIVDEYSCYHIGTSLNYMGNGTFAVIKCEDELQIRQLIERVNSLKK